MIAISLLAAGFLVAWLRFRPHLGTEGAFTDGQRTIEIESVDELRYAVWDAPSPLGGELNSGEAENAPVISPDGRYLVFVVGARGFGTDLWISDLDENGDAQEPRPLIGVNSAADEIAPAFASDGALLFASNRPGGEGGLDIWRSEYGRGVFSMPERLLGQGLNTPSDETDPAAVPGSDEIIFASNRLNENEGAMPAGAPRDFDLYTGRPLPVLEGMDEAWDVEPIAELNTPFDERDPVLSIDGRALLFASDRGATQGSLFGDLTMGSSAPVIGSRSGRRTDTDFDLFRAARTPADHPDPEFTDHWLQPRFLEGVNTDASERHPQPTADGFALLFSRGDGFSQASNDAPRVAIPDEDVNWDVWRATSREVVRTPGKPVGWREIMILVALLLLALLAALAKRWRGMDIIYKAFLVSLLIHLALLFFAREVTPDAGEVELRKGEEERVRIRLMEDPNSIQAQQNEERGGRLEAARNEVQAAADSPERAAAAEAQEVATAAPTAQGALSRAEQEMAAGPTRAETEAMERVADPSKAMDQEVASSAEAFERKTGEARSLEVTARAVESERTESERTEVALDTGLATEKVEVSSRSAPSAAQVAKAADSTESQSTPARRQFTVDRSETAATTDSTRAPSITGPAVEFDRKVADSRKAGESLDVSEAETSDMRRAAAEATDIRAEAPRSDSGSQSFETVVAPSATASLDRSARRSAKGPEVTGPLPRGTGPEPTALRDPAAVSVALAGPAGEAAPTRLSGESTPAFDPLADAGQAGELERSTGPAAEIGAPRINPGGAATSSSDLASAGDLVPSAMTPIGRGGSRAAEGPSFMTPGPTGKTRELDPTAGRATRDVEVADAAGADIPKPRVPGTGGTAGNGPVAADLAPSDMGAPLRRSRSTGGPAGPGLVASGQSPATEGFDSPAPTSFEMATPAAPAPVAGVPAAEVDRDQWDRTPYQSRTGKRKVAALKEYGGGAETERAVESGLAYLARRQRSDGRWGRKEKDDKYGQPMVGKTGLACLAFMGAGHTTKSNTQYSENVAKALGFLVQSQDIRSGHIGNTSSYGHAVATYAMGEAYALTSAPELREPLVRAVQHIVNRQVGSRDPLLDGGWSYYYSDSRTFDRWPRASITAWQVMALESAKLGGIDVPSKVFTRARTFLVNSWDPSRGSFRYSHAPSRLDSEYPVLPGSTPASMFALSLLGADLTKPQFSPAREFVLSRAPDGYRFTNQDDFVFRGQGNLYFWYYGTLSMFRAGSGDWKRWNAALKNTLLPAQEQDGSWRPISVYAGFAQDSEGDRTYTTAMNVLTLEVYYRYFTPLLKVE